ncbi:apolipoprotein A-I-like isoform X2 [Archocentrus centrarchus]|uniref:apolipoprotein A-I-like isoform X2 n=1 Tax=Archocentrus centrarchus TaxID=63155 RepID=UPI0011E9E096|nr:apolipoprotein A-I-like isoform X2 [Archocentrus centrarchus]
MTSCPYILSPERTHSNQQLTDRTGSTAAAVSEMKVLVVLVLAVFTGCNANIMWHEQPKQQADMVKDAFWDYVAKATATAEESLKKIRESQLGQEMTTLIATGTDTINTFTNTMHSKVAPLAQGLMSKFSQEAEQLKAGLEKDLAVIRTRLQPYTEELMAKMEELKKDTAPYTEDPEALKAVLQQKSQELKRQLEQKMNRLQAQMVPYTEEIKEKMQESLEEFQRSLETQMTQVTQRIRGLIYERPS